LLADASLRATRGVTRARALHAHARATGGVADLERRRAVDDVIAVTAPGIVHAGHALAVHAARGASAMAVGIGDALHAGVGGRIAG